MGGSTSRNKLSSPPGKSDEVQTGRAGALGVMEGVELPYDCSVTFSAVEEVIFYSRYSAAVQPTVWPFTAVGGEVTE